MTCSRIEELATLLRARESFIEDWLAAHYHNITPPVYTSVDIRNSGCKMALVDTNLFPAGFNNLCETFSHQAAMQLKAYLERYYPQAKKLLLIPEDHTRNLYYFQNIAALLNIIQLAGYEAILGSSRASLHKDEDIVLAEEETLTLHKIHLENNTLKTDHFIPDLILLNNDLSEGFPNYLKNLQQPVIPSPQMGWHSRRKSHHFELTQQLLNELCGELHIDPWLLSPMTRVEGGIDLNDSICLQRLADSAHRLLMMIRQKYLEHKMTQEPYLFIKNNSGTYGMAVTSVHSGEEILKWNRSTKNKMASAKGGKMVNEYLIQEGIPTADFYRGKPFEPVVYLVGGNPIGVFFRINDQRNQFESLNAKGMTFTCRCFHKLAPPAAVYDLTYHDKGDLFVIASLLGRIASLALGIENGRTALENYSA